MDEKFNAQAGGEAPAETYVPHLTLDPAGAVQAAPAEEKKVDVPAEKLELDRLSPEEQAAVRSFAKQIDISDSTQVMNYGAAAQKNITDFSNQALNKVRTKDLGEVGDMLSDLVIQLKGLDDAGEKKGLRGLFKKGQSSIAELKAKYDKAEVNVDKISAALDEHWRVLTKDIAMMDKMYEMNLAYFKELSMYIIAGKLRVEELRQTELPRLQEKAAQSGLPEDAQAANDYANLLGRFEKKLHDLELTRMISVQMSPQIRMIQNNDSLMAEKIQTSIVNTIPLWKSQMLIALSLQHGKQAMEAQREVTDVTNKLLQKNSEALRQGSIDVARESERGIVELETLKKTNENLIQTLEEVRNIQNEGRARRAEAEEELGRIEGELKQKLLEMRG